MIGTSNPFSFPFVAQVLDEQRSCGCAGCFHALPLEAGDTASWKPALPTPGMSRQLLVAQTSSLPYRGFPIRRGSDPVEAPAVSTPCRLEAGDTAGWKPALPTPGMSRQLLVAQTSSLLYRGFPIRRGSDPVEAPAVSAPCRLEAGDTAECPCAFSSPARRVGSRFWPRWSRACPSLRPPPPSLLRPRWERR